LVVKKGGKVKRWRVRDRARIEKESEVMEGERRGEVR
jgi:hypothetical protein